MEFALWILFGGLVGWLASLLMSTSEDQGPMSNISIGVIGALVGGFVINIIGAPGSSSYTSYSLVVALSGSIILLTVVRGLRTN